MSRIARVAVGVVVGAGIGLVVAAAVGVSMPEVIEVNGIAAFAVAGAIAGGLVAYR